MDFQIFYLINNLATKFPVLDQIGIFFTRWVIFALLATTAISLVKKGKTATVSYIFALIVILLVDQLLNFLISRPRPFVESQVNLLIPAPENLSFPSTHAALAALSASAIFYFSNLGYLKFITIIIAILVGVSRIFVGVHYPLDVLVGFILGVVSFIISVKLMVRLRSPSNLFEPERPQTFVPRTQSRGSRRPEQSRKVDPSTGSGSTLSKAERVDKPD